MSKSKSKTPLKQNFNENFFNKNFLFSSLLNPSELIEKLQSLLHFLIDIDIEDLETIESQKPFHFLLETLIFKDFLQLKDPLICLLLSNSYIQLLRLLKIPLKLTKYQLLDLFSFVVNSLISSVSNLEVVPLTQVYFLIESIQKTKVFSILGCDYPFYLEIIGRVIYILFDTEDLIKKEPELANLYIEILLEISSFEEYAEDIFEKLYPILLFNLLWKQDHGINYQNTVTFIKKSTQKLKKNIGKQIIELFQGKKTCTLRLNGKNFTMKFEDLLIIIAELFKHESEMVLDVIKYVEFELSGKKLTENQRFLCYLLIGNACKHKNSKVSLLFPKIFKDFIGNIINRKFLKIRYNSLKILLKFIQNHYSEREKSRIFDDIEDILLEFLTNNDKDITNKLYIFRSIQSYCLKAPFYFSKKFFQRLFPYLLSKDPFLKENLYIYLIALYKKYCLDLYKSGVYSINTSDFTVEEGGAIIDNKATEKTLAANYQWFFKEFLLNGYRMQKSESIFLINAFNDLLFMGPLDMHCFQGILYNIIYQAYNEGFLIDSNEKLYQNVIYKVLGLKWRVFYEKLGSYESFIARKGFERVLKLKEKVKKLAEKRFLQENSTENNEFLDYKLKKYCSNNDSILVKKVAESLSNAIKEDSNTRVFIERLRKRDVLDEGVRKEAFDFLIKKVKEDNVTILLNVWFGQEFLLSEDWQTSYFSSLSSIFNEKTMNKHDFYIFLSLLEELLLFRKFFDIQLNVSIYMKIFDILHKLMDTTENPLIIEIEEDHNDIYRDILISKLLKLLIKCRINKGISHNESMDPDVYKSLFLLKIKNNNTKPNHCKYLTILINQLDDITSEKSLKHIYIDALEKIDEKSPFLSKNLAIILTYMKISLFQCKMSFFNDTRNEKGLNIFEVAEKIIKNSCFIDKSRGMIISENAVKTTHLLKILYNMLFLQETDDHAFEIHRKSYIEKLLVIVTCSQEKSYGNTTDIKYLRIEALTILLEVLSGKKHKNRLNYEVLTRISYLCFDENVEIRKIFFNFLIKFTSSREKTLESPFIALLFLYLIDPEKTLSFLCKSMLTKLIDMMDVRTAKHIDKLAKDKCIENSVEFTIIYLISIVLNNPFFKGGDMMNWKLFLEFFTNFFELFDKPKHMEFFSIILMNLKRFKANLMEKTKIFGNFLFYTLKKSLKNNEENEEKIEKNNNFTIIINVLNKTLEDKFHVKIHEKTEVSLKIDEKFFVFDDNHLKPFQEDIKGFMEKFKNSKKGKDDRKNTPKKPKKKVKKSKEIIEKSNIVEISKKKAKLQEK